MLGCERGMKSRSEVTIGSLEKRNAYGNIKSALSIFELHAKLYLSMGKDQLIILSVMASFLSQLRT